MEIQTALVPNEHAMSLGYLGGVDYIRGEVNKAYNYIEAALKKAANATSKEVKLRKGADERTSRRLYSREAVSKWDTAIEIIRMYFLADDDEVGHDNGGDWTSPALSYHSGPIEGQVDDMLYFHTMVARLCDVMHVVESLEELDVYGQVATALVGYVNRMNPYLVCYDPALNASCRKAIVWLYDSECYVIDAADVQPGDDVLYQFEQMERDVGAEFVCDAVGVPADLCSRWHTLATEAMKAYIRGHRAADAAENEKEI